MDEGREINVKRFVKYFKRNLDFLPHPYKDAEQSRMLLVYFCLSGIDLLVGIEKEFPKETREKYIKWVYAQQRTIPGEGSGFRGGPVMAISEDKCSTNKYDIPHIAMTYSALLILLILRDDLSNIDRDSIVKFIKELQAEDGSFYTDMQKTECDMRFVYCACAISWILNDWTGINRENVIKYIESCRSYEGGYGLRPNLESHGGSTYCAVASLSLLGALEDLEDKQDLISWVIQRQVSGFQGRVGKPADVCYSFWLGGSLKILGLEDTINDEELMKFTKLAEYKYGGFGKNEDAISDLLHSYFGLCGLALSNSVKFENNINIALGIADSATYFLLDESAFKRSKCE